MKRPNFFIVGAPKCGTTALHTYLGAHPNIFLCEPKEPNYFSTDFPTHRYVTEEQDYLRLFANAGKHERMIGEASAWYLYSKEALTNIQRLNPDARIVVMLRNPIEMFPSLHRMLLLNFAEEEANVEKAWNLQESRRIGNSIPKGRNKRFDPKTLLYADVCKMGAQVERLYKIFPRQQVHVVLFDDFVGDTKSCYEDVISFLQVPSDNRSSFEPVNVRRDFKSRQLAWAFWKFVEIGGTFKRRLGIVKAFNVLDSLNQLNQEAESRPMLAPKFRERLVTEFRTDIDQLSILIGRDLSQLWR